VIQQIDAPSLAQAMRSGRPLALLDVRETWEFETAKIDGSHNVPMSNLPSQLDAIRAIQGGHELVVICHHGVRSMHVARFLDEHGIEDLINLNGGIDAWSQAVDPSVPRY
jgi:rhodanese-related sulfurtransferase